jgi:hypothetical protein
MASYALLNTVLSSLDKKHFVGWVFCDLQKAFDCVNYNTLLTKLEFYGISGVSNELMRSYPNHRYQRVVMKDNMAIKLTSEWEPVKHGVPQELILGPLLFLVYLSRTINKVAKSILFADDTSIVISNTNLEEFKSNINLVMNQTINWFQSSLLSLNCSKTHLLQFLTKKQLKWKFR